MTGVPDMLRVREALEASWEPATAYLDVDDPTRPSLGQCYATARVLQLLHPRLEIVEGTVDTPTGPEKHFWNVARTDAGTLHLDLTWQQFPHGSTVRDWHLRDRDTLGDGPATIRRVERLLDNVQAHLATGADGRTGCFDGVMSRQEESTPSTPTGGGPWLCVLAGRAGTGKTTLAKELARAFGACYLRVDAVETALRRAGAQVGPAGYVVAHELAASNLLLGTCVVVDAVNPVPEARQGWAATAARAGARLVVLETWLPDHDEHRRRVEERTADIPGHRVPTWDAVQDDGWVPWDAERDGPRVVIDTSDSRTALAAAVAALREA